MATRADKKPAKPPYQEGPATDIIEELFNDLNRNRKSIYRLNFYRGIFFGIGSAFGGIIIVAIVIWIVSLLSNTWLGPLVDAIQEAAANNHN